MEGLKPILLEGRLHPVLWCDPLSPPLLMQEEAKSFITPENLEERIEECLDNPRSYNFAIDKEGRVAKQSVLP